MSDGMLMLNAPAEAQTPWGWPNLLKRLDMSESTPERWRPVVRYEGLYEVSYPGDIKSLPRQGTKGGILAQFPDPKGYQRVTLCRNGKRRSYTVHRLVGEAFLGPLPPGKETRHGPAGVQDNSAGNLGYGTSAENEEDKLRDGTRARGSRIPWAVLTEDAVRECRARYAAGGVYLKTLAGEYGVSLASMHDAVTGRTWKHVGGLR